MIINKFKEG